MKHFLGFIVVLMGLFVVGCEELGGEPLPTLPPAPTLRVGTAVPTEVAAIEQSGSGELTGNEAATGGDGGVEGETAAVVETIEPTATATVDASPTPAATPITVPAIEVRGIGNLPAVSRDLLFMADGAVKLWTAHNGQLVELVADGATDMAVSADGNRVVVAREIVTGTTSVLMGDLSDDAEGLQEVEVVYTEHEILWIDTVSKQSQVIAPSVPFLQQLALSPDQRHVTFVAHDLVSKLGAEPFAFPGLGLYLASPTGTVRELSRCDRFCSGMVWRDDGELMLFSDYVGLWLYNINAERPEILIEGGQSVEVGFPRYEPQAWGSNGRTVLLRELRGNGAGDLVLFDLPSRSRSSVPNSAAYSTPTLMSLDWLDDIRLLLLYSPYSPPEANGTRLELWRFDVEASNSLGLDEGVTLAPNVAVRGAGAVHLEDGRFAYGLVHESDPAMAGLYIQTSLTTAAVRVNGLPVGLFEPTVIWSPDGRGAMISGTGEGYYAESEGVLADVSGVLGQDVGEMVWLRPSDALR